MNLDRKPYPNRRAVSREIVGRPLRRTARAGCDEIIASQALATLTRIAASAREDRRRPAVAPPRSRRTSAAQRRRSSPRTAPALVFAVFMIVATTAIASRVAIVSAAPWTAVAYAYLKIPVNLRGLAIQSVRATVDRPTEDNRELLITGEIVNLGETETPVPNLRVILRAEDGHELYVWTARGPKDRLGAHERAAFRTRLAAPPPGVRDALVKFGAPGDKASFTEARG
jgi:hypothetical protein